jgi:hypothetical protein
MHNTLAVATEAGRAAVEDWRVLGSRGVSGPVPVLKCVLDRDDIRFDGVGDLRVGNLCIRTHHEVPSRKNT